VFRVVVLVVGGQQEHQHRSQRLRTRHDQSRGANEVNRGLTPRHRGSMPAAISPLTESNTSWDESASSESGNAQPTREQQWSGAKLTIEQMETPAPQSAAMPAKPDGRFSSCCLICTTARQALHSLHPIARERRRTQSRAPATTNSLRLNQRRTSSTARSKPFESDRAARQCDAVCRTNRLKPTERTRG
jgi:hypothetical protein